jgi:NAD(P)-dependent dehydrogenase (short-subunit alcohol dehydrogenase family)
MLYNDRERSKHEMWGYENRAVVVTGAASGIGRAVAEVLVGLGAEVHAIDLQPVDLEGVAESYGTDLADPASIDATVAALGEVACLFNCAGVPGTVDRRVIFGVNFCGLRHLTEQVAARMTEGAAICSIGSASSVLWLHHVDDLMGLLDTDSFEAALTWLNEHADSLGYPYDVSKEAVNAYTSAAGADLIGRGIRINCINPSATRTPATPEFSKAMSAKELGPEMLKAYPRLAGRLARPIEQAWPMVFLNSPLASYVNGTSLAIDAGFTGGLFTQRFDETVAKAMRWHSPR